MGFCMNINLNCIQILCCQCIAICFHIQCVWFRVCFNIHKWMCTLTYEYEWDHPGYLAVILLFLCNLVLHLRNQDLKLHETLTLFLCCLAYPATFLYFMFHNKQDICKPSTHFQIFLLAVQIYNAKYLQQESQPALLFWHWKHAFSISSPSLLQSIYWASVYMCNGGIRGGCCRWDVASIYSCLF